jgi:hypothetical protein
MNACTDRKRRRILARRRCRRRRRTPLLLLLLLRHQIRLRKFKRELYVRRVSVGNRRRGIAVVRCRRQQEGRRFSERLLRLAPVAAGREARRRRMMLQVVRVLLMQRQRRRRSAAGGAELLNVALRPQATIDSAAPAQQDLFERRPEVAIEPCVDDRVEEAVGVAEPQKDAVELVRYARFLVRAERFDESQNEERKPAHRECAHDDAEGFRSLNTIGHSIVTMNIFQLISNLYYYDVERRANLISA